MYLIKENYKLKNNNTFGLDVVCKNYIEFENIADIQKFANENNFSSDKKIILGGGSNLLFLNDFYNGTVLHHKGTEIKTVEENTEHKIISASAGVVWDDFVKYTCSQNLWGAENLSYIPGTVGASAVQNIGAYGLEAKDIILAVEGVDIQTGETFRLNNEDCKFAYRNSIFKTKNFENKFIDKVYFKLKKKATPVLSYGNMAEKLSSENITPQDVRELIIETRKSKLPEPSELGNAGSFFKNPIVNKQLFQELSAKNKQMPYFKISENEYKIPAGWLIEQAGWKGKQAGNVSTYHKQALVIVNLGKATGKEIADYASMIINSVKNKFNITLNPEVIFVK